MVDDVTCDLVGDVPRDSMDDMARDKVGRIDNMASEEVDEPSLNAVRHAFIKKQSNEDSFTIRK